MSGLLEGFDRASQRNMIEGLASTASIFVFMPAYSECSLCGYDPLTSSGLDPACPICEGSGRTIAWIKGKISGRVSWTDIRQVNIYSGLAIGEIGDCTMQTSLSHRQLLEAVQKTEGAYLFIDGKRVKPVTVAVNRVEGLTSLSVQCNIILPNRQGDTVVE